MGGFGIYVRRNSCAKNGNELYLAYCSTKGKMYHFEIITMERLGAPAKFRVACGDPKAAEFDSLQALVSFYRNHWFKKEGFNEKERFPVWLVDEEKRKHRIKVLGRRKKRPELKEEEVTKLFGSV
uniref:SH2 domain-containing protein n=1 Tax=Steinernema glaseri TaxID=37863 RepID=A0A1I7Y557_9BILA